MTHNLWLSNFNTHKHNAIRANSHEQRSIVRVLRWIDSLSTLLNHAKCEFSSILFGQNTVCTVNFTGAIQEIGSRIESREVQDVHRKPIVKVSCFLKFNFLAFFKMNYKWALPRACSVINRLDQEIVPKQLVFEFILFCRERRTWRCLLFIELVDFIWIVYRSIMSHDSEWFMANWLVDLYETKGVLRGLFSD